jgi:hypothetical protein
LLKVLPEAYLACEFDAEEDADFARRLRRLYRVGIQLVDAELLSPVGSRYVSVLKEEPEEVVRKYELGLFRGSDLQHIDLKDHPLVTAHFFATMRQGLNDAVFEAAHGFVTNLQGDSLKEFVTILASAIARDHPANIRAHGVAGWFFGEVWEENPPEGLATVIAELRQEYEWNGRMQKVLDEMLTMVEVPF